MKVKLIDLITNAMTPFRFINIFFSTSLTFRTAFRYLVAGGGDERILIISRFLGQGSREKSWKIGIDLQF